MALVPSNYWRDWWDDFERPSKVLDKYFERNITHAEVLETLRWPTFRSFFRPWGRSLSASLSELDKIENDADKFKVVLDVRRFYPHEILVKTLDNSIIVEAKHEDKEDPFGYVSRRFHRRYDLPKGHDIRRVTSSLSTDGILTINAPKVVPPPGERIVPVDRTYFPALKSPRLLR
ncbi:protein lethal(2)essential for life-like [Diachasmimorpha longicaudata]|uniref:protein lethal(2)essential for life-like n=1 Tax=Diachasmimorpha longicaudata TaxID=58733 RepID=UPI0030B8B22D